MRRSSLPCTTDEVLAVARRAALIAEQYGLKCCLMGSTACLLRGATRRPNDVDLVVLTTLYDQETLKRLLVSKDTNFYLVNSKDIFATYKVLWYRLGLRRSCKVDILIPGSLNIPNIPHNQVEHIRGLPVMPIIPLVLLKLQGWEDHRNSTKAFERAKEFVDITDVKQILAIACQQDANVSAERNNLPQSLITAAEGRALLFVGRCPETRSLWRSFGLMQT